MRVLVITMLDLDKETNQRTHHVIRMLEGIADEVVVGFRDRAMGRRPRDLLRDACRAAVRETVEGRRRTFAIHPPLNYAQSMAAGVVQTELGRDVPPLRRGLGACLSFLGIARDIALLPGFSRLLEKRLSGTFDVCHAEGPWSAAVALWLKRRGRVRRIIYDDIDYVAGGQALRLRSAYVGWLERATMARADTVASAGWLLGEHRRRTLGRDVTVIPNGVDPSRFIPARRKVPHPPTLTYVGNIAHYAGLDLAIQALPAIRLRIPEVRLLIVGPGDVPYIEGLRRLAARLDVASGVEIRGPVPYDAVPGILAESDVGLATFRTNPLGAYAFPLKVVEYMAAGLPFMCTRGSESEALLGRFPCGRAIAYDPSAFAAAALELLSDRELYQRLSDIAVSSAESLTWADSMKAQRALVIAAAV